MKIVVDNNVLFTFFWKNSFTRKLFLNQGLELNSPEYALEEINKYSEEITRKAGISLKEFKETRDELAILVEFIPLEKYSDFLKKAINISPDENDIDFFALALKYDAPIWGNDKILKNQKSVEVFSTFDIAGGAIPDEK